MRIQYIYMFPNFTQNLTCGVCGQPTHMSAVRHAERKVYVNGSSWGYAPLRIQAEVDSRRWLSATMLGEVYNKISSTQAGSESGRDSSREAWRMIEGRASRTARDQTLIRAIESLAPRDRRVCYDPLAVEFLDEKFRRNYRLTQNRKFLTKLWLWMLHRDPSGSKAETAGRTKYVDDYLQAHIDNGVEQIVVLGAGHDSRAYRFKALERIRVFEVDHPDTQRMKKSTIKRLLGHLPLWVTYVPIDFEKDHLDEKMLASGYSRDSRTLFIWEGVTMYLTPEAVDRTLSFVVMNSSEGSSIIFNYWYRSAVDGRDRRANAIRKRCKRFGEPITFGIEGENIEEFLVARGFSRVKRVTPTLLKRACFQGPNSRRKTCPFVETVHATIGSPK